MNIYNPVFPAHSDVSHSVISYSKYPTCGDHSKKHRLQVCTTQNKVSTQIMGIITLKEIAYVMMHSTKTDL